MSTRTLQAVEPDELPAVSRAQGDQWEPAKSTKAEAVVSQGGWVYEEDDGGECSRAIYYGTVVSRSIC